MAEPEMIHLFSYGTLRQPDVQLSSFGRLLDGTEDALPGYRLGEVEITDPEVLKASDKAFHPIAERSSNSADVVTGTVFRITQEELWAADDYEAADYARTRARLASGLEAFVYVRADEVDASPSLDALVAAERRAFALLDAIEAAGIIAPGRSELEIEHGIYTIAARDFGVTAHWHDRVVRAGPNTLCVAGEAAPDRIVEDDDIVFLDLGPVFGEWEADVGRSYVVGDDPHKTRLVSDLEIIFEAVRARYLADAAMTGAGLYAIALEEAARRGWRFGGRIAGHLVGKFPYARSPAGRDGGRVSPANDRPMRDLDTLGRPRHWILEIHLVAPDGSFGGFCERLLLEN